MFKITIPKPCFEGWNNMTPNERGKYCNACSKTVVDFSVMSDEAVQEYISLKYGQKLCGRFKTTQIQRITIELPCNIFHIPLPLWKKFLVIFLICFGGSFFSIDTTFAGIAIKENAVIFFGEKTKGLNTGEKKPKIFKQKKHQRKKKKIFMIPVETIIMGNMFPTHMSPDADNSPLDASIKTKKNNHTDTGSTVKSITTSNNSEKDTIPKIPVSNLEFILPKIAMSKNSFSKKKRSNG